MYYEDNELIRKFHKSIEEHLKPIDKTLLEAGSSEISELKELAGERKGIRKAKEMLKAAYVKIHGSDEDD